MSFNAINELKCRCPRKRWKSVRVLRYSLRCWQRLFQIKLLTAGAQSNPSDWRRGTSMISRAEVDSLLEFQNGDYLVTSCYLILDRTKQQPQMLKIRVKDLLH